MLLVRPWQCAAKKGKTLTQSRRLQAKGEMCTLQTGKFFYNAIYINNITSLNSYAEFSENSISRLSWSFIKEFAVSSCRCTAVAMLSCACWHRVSEQSYESYIYSWIELELAWFKVSTKVSGFTFRSISLHFKNSKKIKEILTQKQEYNAKCLFRFND